MMRLIKNGVHTLWEVDYLNNRIIKQKMKITSQHKVSKLFDGYLVKYASEYSCSYFMFKSRKSAVASLSKDLKSKIKIYRGILRTLE